MVNFILNSKLWGYELKNKTLTAIRGHKFHIIPNNSLPLTISIAILILVLFIVINLHLNILNIDYMFDIIFLTRHFNYFTVGDWFTFITPFRFMFCYVSSLYPVITNHFVFGSTLVSFSKMNFISWSDYLSFLNDIELKHFASKHFTEDLSIKIYPEISELLITSLNKLHNYLTLDPYSKLNIELYFFWCSPFILTLGIFFVWCSVAIEEGSDIVISKKNIKFNNNNFFSYNGLSPTFHNNVVRKGFKAGFILFIISEIMFFFGFFFGFFYSALSPVIQIGGVWPPIGVEFITVKGFAIANTVILLTSGLTLTIAHYAIELLPQK